MGYATVMRVPRFADYNEAFKKWNTTKPILGRSPELRPLGERRDCDTYSIRKNVWTQAIECVLYQTPVIKFTVEGEVIINIGAWPSASTCQFISRVLSSVSASRVRGDVVLSFADGSKAQVTQNKEITLARKDGRWMPTQAQTLYDYRVNRKEANNVRKAVSQFRDYLSGVVKLKTDVTVRHEGMPWESRDQAVPLTYGELIETLGKEISTHDSGTVRFRPDVRAWYRIGTKPQGTNPELWENYHTNTEKFYELIKNDQDDNVRYQNYWIAFCILFVEQHPAYAWTDDLNVKVYRPSEGFERDLDRILMTMFADKVFKMVALPQGKVPTGKYDNYVRSEE